jgi:hypothetical protein
MAGSHGTILVRAIVCDRLYTNMLHHTLGKVQTLIFSVFCKKASVVTSMLHHITYNLYVVYDLGGDFANCCHGHGHGHG